MESQTGGNGSPESTKQAAERMVLEMRVLQVDR